MRSLQGVEAIELAELSGAPLYDTEFQREVALADVLEDIERNRSVRAFSLPFWPETEEEAEQVVLRAFRKTLEEAHRSESSIGTLFPNSLQSGPIHPLAAAQAAERLVQTGQLALARVEDTTSVYRMQEDVQFADSILAELRSVVCPGCAKLRLTEPFHESCLTNLIDLLKRREFTLSDLVAATSPKAADTILSDGNWLRAASRTGESVQKLAKSALATSLATGRKWQDVLRSVANRNQVDRATTGASANQSPTTGNTPSGVPSDDRVGAVKAASSPNHLHGPATDAVSVARGEESEEDSGERIAITQDDLISYLAQVDIVPSRQEAEVRLEHAQTLRHMADKELEIQELRKQRNYVEQQFAELQRDMETVLQALQIAKRRDDRQEHVIDALYESTPDR